MRKRRRLVELRKKKNRIVATAIEEKEDKTLTLT